MSTFAAPAPLGEHSASRTAATVVSRPSSDTQPATTIVKPAKSNANWRHFVAGGVGGMIGATMTCPLEVIKTRLQSKALSTEGGMISIARNIAQAEGIRGFWKGLGPMLVGVVPARAVYFATYDGAKCFLNSYSAEGTTTHMLSAICAGAATNTMINPVWVVKTRMQLQSSASSHADSSVQGSRYRNSFHAVTSILKEDGIKGFYRGLVPSLWGISEGALQFMLYEDFKRRRTEYKRSLGVAADAATAPTAAQEKLGAAEYLCIAATSKLIASVATYPHEVIRTRMRERGASTLYKSAGHCIRRVWAEEGMRGMYGGMWVHLVRVVPNTAILFFTYETVSRWLA